MPARLAVLIAGLVLVGGSFAVQAAGSGTHQQLRDKTAKGAQQPYAGQQNRAVSSLSEDDIAALNAGAGWGFAKPAELNGYPGPRHVLDMADELQLTADQKAKIEEIFAGMAKSAKAIGPKYIEAEAQLDQLFKSGAVNETELLNRVKHAGAIRSDLRNVHLKAHITTHAVLNMHQRQMYDRLRGYADGASHSGPHGSHSGSGHRGSHGGMKH